MKTLKLNQEVIEGNKIILEPLSPSHISELCDCLLGEPDGWFSRMYGLNSKEVLSNAFAGPTNTKLENPGGV